MSLVRRSVFTRRPNRAVSRRGVFSLAGWFLSAAVLLLTASCNQLEGLDFSGANAVKTTAAQTRIAVQQQVADIGVIQRVCAAPSGITYFYNARYDPDLSINSGTVTAYDKTGTRVAVSVSIPEFAFFCVDTIGSAEYLSVFTVVNGSYNSVNATYDYTRKLYSISGTELPEVALSSATVTIPGVNLVGNLKSIEGGASDKLLLFLDDGYRGSILEFATGVSSAAYTRTVVLNDSAVLSVWDAGSFSDNYFTALTRDPAGGYLVLGYRGDEFSTSADTGSARIKLNDDLSVLSLVYGKRFLNDAEAAGVGAGGTLYCVRGSRNMLIALDPALKPLSATPIEERALSWGLPYLLTVLDGEVLLVSNEQTANETHLIFERFSL